MKGFGFFAAVLVAGFALLGGLGLTRGRCKIAAE